MDEEKNLREFLEALKYNAQCNIDFLEKKTPFTTGLIMRYLKELSAVQNLINSFDFVKKKD